MPKLMNEMIQVIHDGRLEIKVLCANVEDKGVEGFNIQATYTPEINVYFPAVFFYNKSVGRWLKQTCH